MPKPEMRTAEAERHAEMVASLRKAFPLPHTTDPQFGELLAKLASPRRSTGETPADSYRANASQVPWPDARSDNGMDGLPR